MMIYKKEYIFLDLILEQKIKFKKNIKYNIIIKQLYQHLIIITDLHKILVIHHQFIIIILIV